MQLRFPVSIIILALLISAGLPTSYSKVDPLSGLIRVVCIGESHIHETRLPVLLGADPRITYQPIPANWYESTFQAVGGGREDALKFIRQYMPRTYDRLIDTYDVILLSDFEVDIITEEQFSWMEQSVREVGMGLGKYEMNYDPSHFGTFNRFVASSIYSALPADLQWGKTIPTPLEGIYPVTIPGTGKPHPMLDLPGMNKFKVLNQGTYGYEIPRAGAIVIARFKPKDEDAMIIRDYGEGKTLACLPGHDKIDGNAIAMWPYTIDFWVNQMWYLSGLEIPEDAELVHQLRERSLTYSGEKSLTTAVIEFVEKFGASTRKLYDELSEADDLKRESNRLYLKEQYQESLEKLEEAFEGLKRVSDNSVKVKETALFWIYMIEWFTVTGTCVLTGFVLWTLMIRRRLYRQVAVTRSR